VKRLLHRIRNKTSERARPTTRSQRQSASDEKRPSTSSPRPNNNKKRPKRKGRRDVQQEVTIFSQSKKFGNETKLSQEEITRRRIQCGCENTRVFVFQVRCYRFFYSFECVNAVLLSIKTGYGQMFFSSS